LEIQTSCVNKEKKKKVPVSCSGGRRKQYPGYLEGKQVKVPLPIGETGRSRGRESKRETLWKEGGEGRIRSRLGRREISNSISRSKKEYGIILYPSPDIE